MQGENPVWVGVDGFEGGRRGSALFVDDRSIAGIYIICNYIQKNENAHIANPNYNPNPKP